MLLTSDLAKHNIPRTYLNILLQKGEINRISRGVYSATNAIPDEMVSLQARFKVAVYSHETALYLLDLTDRTPYVYSVTVRAGYNANSLKDTGAKVYFINRERYSIGKIVSKSPHGNDIWTYDLERTVCDILRNRNQIDVQLLNEAIKRYSVRKEKRLDRLSDYAGKFGIQKIVRDYLEVLL